MSFDTKRFESPVDEEAMCLWRGFFFTNLR